MHVATVMLTGPFTQYLSQSKRFMPELVNFLTSVLGYFAADEAGT